MVVIGLLAHQGGWDEVALVGAPVMVFGGLLALARRRALAMAERREPDSGPSADRDP